MLRELHIQNLAVIEDAAIDLRGGLNCFTGQTGAGKSLVIGAFEVLLGLRKAADLLRDGADEGRVSGVFEMTDPETIRRVSELGDLDLEPETTDDPATETPEQLLITRKLFASGRSSVSINGRPATAAMLRAIGQLLVDVHGQHDHQYLLKPANQLAMLDRFADCEDLRKHFADLHRQLNDLRRRKAELEASATLRRQQLELYEFQAKEIDDAEPTEGEYDEIAARHKLLANLEKVQGEAGQAYAALYESDGAILERLQAIVGVLRQLNELDEELNPIAESLRGGMAQLQDAAFDLGRYVNRIDLDPAELDEVTERLNTLNRLIHKYGTGGGPGGTLEDVLAYRQQIGSEIERLRAESEDQGAIDQQIEPLRQQMLETGRQLSEKRRAAADQLKPAIETELAELGMKDAAFDTHFDAIDPDEHDTATGLDAIELMVRANPGQAARPLRKVASGGELSRIMLAIKSIAATADRISVLVFDEIDANIGGRMGTVIGQKLRRLAAGHQVLCITHLPQIAAFADRHFRIAKGVDEGRTRTAVEPIEENERLDELAAMLSGEHATETTRRQAREMIALAENDTATAPTNNTAAETESSDPTDTAKSSASASRSKKAAGQKKSKRSKSRTTPGKSTSSKSK